MRGSMPPIPQYAFMTWCSVKSQGQLHLDHKTTRRYKLKMEAAWASETLMSLPQDYTASQPEDGGNKVLRNVGILPRHYTA